MYRLTTWILALGMATTLLAEDSPFTLIEKETDENGVTHFDLEIANLELHKNYLWSAKAQEGEKEPNHFIFFQLDHRGIPRTQPLETSLNASQGEVVYTTVYDIQNRVFIETLITPFPLVHSLGHGKKFTFIIKFPPLGVQTKFEGLNPYEIVTVQWTESEDEDDENSEIISKEEVIQMDSLGNSEQELQADPSDSKLTIKTSDSETEIDLDFTPSEKKPLTICLKPLPRLLPNPQ